MKAQPIQPASFGDLSSESNKLKPCSCFCSEKCPRKLRRLREIKIPSGKENSETKEEEEMICRQNGIMVQRDEYRLLKQDPRCSNTQRTSTRRGAETKARPPNEWDYIVWSGPTDRMRQSCLDVTRSKTFYGVWKSIWAIYGKLITSNCGIRRRISLFYIKSCRKWSKSSKFTCKSLLDVSLKSSIVLVLDVLVHEPVVFRTVWELANDIWRL